MIVRSAFALVALIAIATATTATAQSCPDATASRLPWLEHEGRAFGLAIRAPLSFRPKRWENRSDTTSLEFSLWENAVTTIDFSDPTHWLARDVTRAQGDSCTLGTRAGAVRRKLWRITAVLPGPRDTTYFRAGGELRLPKHPRVLVLVTAGDSLALLRNLQILQTLRPLEVSKPD